MVAEVNGDATVLTLSDVDLEGLDQCTIDDPTRFVLVDCPICDSTENSIDICEVWGSDTPSLFTSVCTDCSHVYHRRRPDPDWYKEFYLSKWDRRGRGRVENQKLALHNRLARLPRLAARRLISPIRWWNRHNGNASYARSKILRFWPEIKPNHDRELEQVGDVLEIGCGSGEELLNLRLAGFDVCGIESSRHRVQLAQQWSGASVLNIATEDLGEVSFGKKFDLVYSHHVLEHVFDPNHLIDAVKRVLKPRGYLYLAVPNLYKEFLLQVFHFAPHTNNFTPGSLTFLLEKHGFVIERMAVDNEIQILARRRESDAESEFYPSVDYRTGTLVALDNQLERLFQSNCTGTYRISWLAPSAEVAVESLPDHTQVFTWSSKMNYRRVHPRHVTLRIESKVPRVSLPLRIINQDQPSGALWVK